MFYQEKAGGQLDLEHNLIEYGDSLENLPWVIQYNKRDLPNSESIETLEKKLNFFGVPYFESVAHQGVNVFPTLKTIINRVVEKIQHAVT